MDLGGLRGVAPGRRARPRRCLDGHLGRDREPWARPPCARPAAFWGTDWARRVVVVAPATLERVRRAAGRLSKDAARQFAAVTTGRAARRAGAPPLGAFVGSRVYVNPDAWQELTSPGSTSCWPTSSPTWRRRRSPAPAHRLAGRGCGGRGRLPPVPVSPRTSRCSRSAARCGSPALPPACPGPTSSPGDDRQVGVPAYAAGRRRGPAHRADATACATLRGDASGTRADRPRRGLTSGRPGLRAAQRPAHDAPPPSPRRGSRAGRLAGALGSGACRRTLVVTNDFPPRPGRHPDLRARAGTPPARRLRRGLRLPVEGSRGVRRRPALSRGPARGRRAAADAGGGPAGRRRCCARTTATASCSAPRRPWACSPAGCARPGPGASSG